MAEKNENADIKTHEDGPSDEDNSFLGEWTLLDKMSHDSMEKKATVRKRSIIQSKKYVDAEIAREAIQVLEPPLSPSETAERQSIENNGSKCFTENNADSNGQTVITGNHEENDESQISTISNPPVNQNVTPIGTFTNIIIACLITGLIGFSIGCIVSTGETQLSANEVDFRYTGNTACGHDGDKLTNKQTVRPDVDVGTIAVGKQPGEILEQVLHNEQFMNVDGNDHLKNDGSLRAILEKVKFSLDILCSIIDNNIHESRESNEYGAVCAKPLGIMNLIELKNNMQSLVTDIGFIEDRSNEWFMNNINSELNDISIALANDLSMTIRNSVAKIERKINRMKHKLDQRLCFIRNTIADDVRIQEILNKYESSFKACPAHKSAHEVKIERSRYKLEKNGQYMRKHIHTHAVGPDVGFGGLDNGSSDVRVNYKDYRGKESSPRTEQDKSYRWKKGQKSQKKLPKGDFTSERENIESKKLKTEKNHERIVVLPKIAEKSKNERDTEQFCDTNLCARQRVGDRKNDPGQKYGNWQFQRSEGRFNWRAGKNVLNENSEMSWSDKRARARKSARDEY